MHDGVTPSQSRQTAYPSSRETTKMDDPIPPTSWNPMTLITMIRSFGIECKKGFKHVMTQQDTRNKAIYTTLFCLFSITHVLISNFLVLSLLSNLTALYSVYRMIEYAIDLIIVALQHRFNTPKWDILAYSYGPGRFEVLLRFSNGIFGLFIGCAIITEGVKRFADHHLHGTADHWILAMSSLLIQAYGVYMYKWADFKESLQKMVEMNRRQTRHIPMWSTIKSFMKAPSKREPFIILFQELLLPFILLGMSLITLNDRMNVNVDVILTFFLAMLSTLMTWVPLARSGFILLQTSPEPMIPKINKLLREASIIEGVLECHSEHFWSIGYEQKSTVGTLKVRVTNDANEQKVLKAIHDLFEKHVGHLTIQIEKVFVDKNTNFVPIVVNE